MKRCMILLMALMLCISAAAPAFAAAPKPRIVDDAGVLTQSEVRELEKLLDEISLRQGVDVVVVVADSIGGMEPKAAAKNLYRAYGYGSDGVMLLINMEHQDWAIQGMGGAQAMFTEAGRNYIADQVVPMLSDSEFAEAFRLFGTLCDDFITQARTGDPYDDHNLPQEPYPVLMWVGISLVVGLVVALIVTAIMRSKLKSVRYKNQAMDYVRPGSMQVTESRDIFLYRNVTRRPRPKPSSSGGGRSSSGGGTSGKF